MIAIIAILAGMLLPALGQVKETGKRTSCMSQEKQLGIMYANYEQRYGGFPPDALHTWVNPQGKLSEHWQHSWRWFALLGINAGYEQYTKNMGYDCSVLYIAKGTQKKWPPKTIFLCPSGQAHNESYRYFHYSKSYIGNSSSGGKLILSQKLTKPSLKVNLREGSYQLGYTSGMGAAGKSTTSISDKFGINDFYKGRHEGYVNWLYFDGHTATIPAKEVQRYSDSNAFKAFD